MFFYFLFISIILKNSIFEACTFTLPWICRWNGLCSKEKCTSLYGECNERLMKGNVVIASSYYDQYCNCIHSDTCIQYDSCDNDYCTKTFGLCDGEYNRVCDCIPFTTTTPSTTIIETTVIPPTTTLYTCETKGDCSNDYCNKKYGHCSGEEYIGGKLASWSYYDSYCMCYIFDTCIGNCDAEYCIRTYGSCDGEYNRFCDCIPFTTTTTPSTTIIETTVIPPTTTLYTCETKGDCSNDYCNKKYGHCSGKSYIGGKLSSWSYYDSYCICYIFDTCIGSCDAEYCIRIYGSCDGEYNRFCDCIPFTTTTTPSTTIIETTVIEY